MKKSIVAMLSITALATVANAETWSGTGGTHFEGTTVGNPFYGFLDDSGNSTDSFFWFAATNNVYCESQFGTYTNSADLGTYKGDRPAIAGKANTTNKCLAIETDGGRLYRRMEGTTDPDEGLLSFTQHDVTSSIYFDSLVQFTVNEDDAPAPQDGDKLVVWLKGDEANQTTNLVVTAGFLDPNNTDPLVASNYVTTASVEPGTWHRLTIEAYNLVTAEGSPVIGEDQGSGYLGFRVRIDGQLLTTSGSVGDVSTFVSAVVGTGDATTEALTYAANFELFPSLAYGAKQCTSLSCVAFEGTGAIDDLTFTDTNPFGSVEPPVSDVPGFVVDGVTNTCATVEEFKAAFKAGQTLALPNGWSFNTETGAIGPDGGEPYATVPTYYNVDATTGAISLNETVVKPVIGTTEGAGTESDTEPITVGATTVTLNVTNAKDGLYYGVRKYTVIGGTYTDTWNQTAQEGDGNVTLTVEKTANATAEFYQIIVNDVLPATPAPASGE